MKQFNPLLALVALAPVTTACQNAAFTRDERGFDIYAVPGELVAVDANRRINLRCSGKGTVTVLFESGLGYPSYSWRKVQPQVAKFARACSYDRAGLGFSDAGPMPRSASAAARDISSLVSSGAIKSPLLLVGGSLGGQIVRLYAFRNPDKVAAMVLVDPYAEGQYQAFAKIEPSFSQELVELAAEEKRCVKALRAGLSSAEAEKQGCVQAPSDDFSPYLQAIVRQQRIAPKDYEAVYSESLMLDSQNEADIAREKRDLSPMPLIVLSATDEYTSDRLQPVRAPLLAEKARLHQQLAALSIKGEVRLVEAAHVIQSDAPEAVVKAIQDAIEGRKAPE
ncbi:MAG: alpha/beta fold hydrolase [Sphingorhabdus sp.]